jgi:hypothetical protein
MACASRRVAALLAALLARRGIERQTTGRAGEKTTSL